MTKTKLEWHRKRRQDPAYRQHEREWNRQHHLTTRGRATALLRACRLRAKKFNLPCGITADWIEERLQHGKCEVTNIQFKFVSAHTGGSRVHEFTPSLDQKVPGLGYTLDNTQVVIWAYNRLKADGTDEQAKSLIVQMHEGIRS